MKIDRRLSGEEDQTDGQLPISVPSIILYPDVILIILLIESHGI